MEAGEAEEVGDEIHFLDDNVTDDEAILHECIDVLIPKLRVHPCRPQLELNRDV